MERGECLARRKELYEARPPETRNVNERGGPGRGHKTTAESAAVSLPTFTDDTANKTGRKQRTVREDVQIATRIAPEVRDAIRHTPLADRKDDLVKLSRMTPERQDAVAEKTAPASRQVQRRRVRPRTDGVYQPSIGG